MKRRQLLTGSLAAAWVAPAHADAKAWAHKVLSGGFDGAIHHVGLKLILKKGWKTYWRNPGEGGVPPVIDMKSANLAAITFDFPLPQHLSDGSGDSVGYKDEVVFPVRLTPINPAKTLEGMMSAFFGVCETVCIPVPLDLPVSFAPDVASGPDAIELQHWQLRVPKLRDTGPVLRAMAVSEGLQLELKQPVSDLFVDFPEGRQDYLGAPRFTEKSALFKTSEKLKDRRIRVTSLAGNTGVEQLLTVV